MKLILYILLIIPSLIITGAAFPLAFVLPLFMDEKGDLPWQLSWFQMSDNPLFGDACWANDHPTWGVYRLALFYQWRNPAQGWDQYIRANVTEQTPWNCRGNINIADGVGGIGGWYLITANGYFHFSFVLPLSKWLSYYGALIVAIGYVLVFHSDYPNVGHLINAIGLIVCMLAINDRLSVLNTSLGTCLTGGYGWRLNSLVKGYSHPTLGQYCFTLGARLQKFS